MAEYYALTLQLHYTLKVMIVIKNNYINTKACTNISYGCGVLFVIKEYITPKKNKTIYYD